MTNIQVLSLILENVWQKGRYCGCGNSPLTYPRRTIQVTQNDGTRKFNGDSLFCFDAAICLPSRTLFVEPVPRNPS
jgi:hypothetical protein